ncbi:hypothetical protein NDU88_002337 [Pleurodeles waltl]|uniref:Uncharacterized protein n=1 Tax=Pleurodeles waltl TaxID=8319 RepID=A0AAV7RDH1_PLEWA|nr:hypothetical protein NDU88_002337 [Pleurodeles waltl]
MYVLLTYKTAPVPVRTVTITVAPQQDYQKIAVSVAAGLSATRYAAARWTTGTTSRMHTDANRRQTKKTGVAPFRFTRSSPMLN